MFSALEYYCTTYIIAIYSIATTNLEYSKVRRKYSRLKGKGRHAPTLRILLITPTNASSKSIFLAIKDALKPHNRLTKK
jgi:hypothetical protein